MENQNNACSNASFEIAEKIPIQKDQTYYNLTDEDNIPKSAIKVKDLSDFVLHGKNTKEKFEIQFKVHVAGSSLNVDFLCPYISY